MRRVARSLLGDVCDGLEPSVARARAASFRDPVVNAVVAMRIWKERRALPIAVYSLHVIAVDRCRSLRWLLMDEEAFALRLVVVRAFGGPCWCAQDERTRDEGVGLS